MPVSCFVRMSSAVRDAVKSTRRNLQSGQAQRAGGVLVVAVMIWTKVFLFW